MSESGDYTPGAWGGHDFAKARAAYDTHVGRSYADATSAGKDKSEFFEPKLETKCANPLVIVCDVTGSMGTWPAVIFEKLPYLDHEMRTEYLGEDAEVSYAATGDANGDRYPVQVRPFAHSTAQADRLKQLVIEGNGGGQLHETYELLALYYARLVSMPNALKPIIIFIGDEKPYPTIHPSQALAHLGIKLQDEVSTADVFDELKGKFSVYFIHKPYGNSSVEHLDPTSKEIYACWEKLVGADHICMLAEAQRVVDVIFGILAAETGKVDYFRKEIEDRQKPKQVKTVYKSLETVHLGAGDAEERKKLTAGRSTMHRPLGGTKMKPLLPS